MGVGRWGLVRLRGWGKEGAGSQLWMDLRMERKKETEGSEREREKGRRGEEERKRKETRREWARQRQTKMGSGWRKRWRIKRE